MIMDLPLFKGVGRDHVSLFLEKTNIGFHNYKGGDTIADVGEAVRMVRFVISGEVDIIHRLQGAGISVEERAGAGRVLGADRLFGFDTGYPYRVVAAMATSVMEFSKEQYINLLHTDNIYMLNFFNYLSLRAQRPVEAMKRFCRGDIDSMMRQLVCVLTDPGAKGVAINGSDKALAEYCATTEDEINDWKHKLRMEMLAECEYGRIRLLSRGRFLDF